MSNLGRMPTPPVTLVIRNPARRLRVSDSSAGRLSKAVRLSDLSPGASEPAPHPCRVEHLPLLVAS